MALLETIKCKDGILYNLEWHNIRFNHARKVYFGLSTKMNLVNFIKVPSSSKKGLLRCRISYTKTIDKVEFIPHQNRNIESLKLIEANEIDYGFKYSDRKNLTKLFDQRNNCDDILIVKNGSITDSYTANAIFFDGEKWWTSDSPLLPGTKRAKLIFKNKLSVCSITPDNLSKYIQVGLINAMWDLENMPIIDMKNILK